MRLSFKGDQPKRKRSRIRTPKGESSHTYDDESDVEHVGGDEQAWVRAETSDEVHGPAFLYQAGDSGRGHALSFNVHLTQVESAAVAPPELPADLVADGAVVVGTELTPQNVYQVWVATKLPELEQWTLKSAPGTFLGCDRFGSVLGTNEARGPQEEWVVHAVEVRGARPEGEALPPRTVLGPRAGLAFQSHYGGWLALEEESETQTKRRVRADATELSAACVWDVQVQWKFRHAVRHASRTAKKVARLDGGNVLDEEQISRSRQGWNAGSRAYLPTGSRQELEQAKRDGRLSEAMLDRRSKLKRDKFAWVRRFSYTVTTPWCHGTRVTPCVTWRTPDRAARAV